MCKRSFYSVLSPVSTKQYLEEIIDMNSSPDLAKNGQMGCLLSYVLYILYMTTIVLEERRASPARATVCKIVDLLHNTVLPAYPWAQADWRGEQRDGQLIVIKILHQPLSWLGEDQ